MRDSDGRGPAFEGLAFKGLAFKVSQRRTFFQRILPNTVNRRSLGVKDLETIELRVEGASRSPTRGVHEVTCADQIRDEARYIRVK